MNQHNTPVIIEINEERYEISSEQLENLFFEKKEGDDYMFRNGDSGYFIKVFDYDRNTGICVLSVDGELREARMIRDIDIMIEKMGLNASHSKKQPSLLAPMPGLVTGIKVEVRQKIEKGSPLIILEAMKMENVISAPHDAVIKDIKVTIGQAVERGYPLIEFE